MSDSHTVDRRSFLAYVGAAGAATSVAGCSGGPGEGTDTETNTETPSGPGEDTTPVPTDPSSRTAYLERANSIANIQAPWIFLNRQYSVYGKSSRIEWKARRDERIDAGAITPTEDGNDVTITLGQLDSGLDPHDHRETPTDNIVLQAYEGLLQRDRTGAIVEGLASGYERLEEGRVKFTVREGVSFHNGDSLTPEDVAFSINRIVDENVGNLASPQADQLAGVTGAEVVDGERAVAVSSDGINPIVFQLFASYCDVMQKDWVMENSTGDDTSYINQNVNGTGPFALQNYEQDVEVVFERFGDYWGDAPDVETLTFNGAKEASTRVNKLLGGESDIVVNVPPQETSRVQESDNASVSAVPSTRVLFNAMRYDVEPFDSAKFRRAMNYAVDLGSIVENVLQTFGDETGQPTLEGFVGYNDDANPYPHNPDKAEDLVDESGYDGAELTLHTPVGRYLKDVAIAQAVANQIDQLENVSCEVRQREFSSLASELLTGNIEDKPHFYLIGWGNSTFDASQTLIPLLKSDGALTTWSNDEFDEMLEQAQGMAGEQ